MAETLSAALAMYDAGLCVVRGQADGSKKPEGTWKQYQSARPDRDQVESWFAGGHPAVGVVCGAVSGNLEMLEVEGRAVDEGALVIIQDAVAAAGYTDLWRRIRDGYVELSPSGGRHWMYQISDQAVPSNTKIAERLARPDEFTVDEREVLAKYPNKPIKRVLVETRGEGGFVMTAPSHGPTHETGKPWVLGMNSIYGVTPTITWEEREMLHRIIRAALDQMPQQPPKAAPKAPATDLFDGPNNDRPGDIWARQTSWAQILEPHGWTYVYSNNGQDLWRRPGKRLGISARTGGEFDSLFVFSTSTEFDDLVSITKFRAYSVLEHGGDDSAAAKELYRRGHAAPPPPRVTVSEPDAVDGLELPAEPPVAGSAMYHGLLGEIVEVSAPSTEADPIGVLVSLMSGVGAAIGPGAYVQVGNTVHPLLIWPLLFGRTGSGRKGEAGETAAVFLKRGSATYLDIAVTGLSSGEGLIERIRDPDPNNEKDTGGTSDKRLAVTEPEFASVMARAKREGSTLAYVLREAWSGKPLSVMNRKALHASYSHVAIAGHITPKEFRLRLAEADMAGGTFNRFLPAYVDRSKKLPIPAGVDLITINKMGSKLQSAITGAKELGAIGLTGEAVDLWTGELYDELTEADDEDALWTEFARRAAPYCRRIAALYAAIGGRRDVSKDDLTAAATLVRYSIDSAKFVLDGRRRDPRIDRIVRAIDAAGDKGLSQSEVSALFSRKLTAQVLSELLGQLLETKRYELVKVPTGGRPAEMYRRAKEVK